MPHRPPRAPGAVEEPIARGPRLGAPQPTGAERRALAWVTLAGLLLGLGFAVGVPLFQNPDEPSHVDRVRHQAQHPFDLPDAELRMRRSVVKTSERVGLPMRFHTAWPGDLGGPRPDFPSFSAGIGPDRPACPACQSYQYAHPPAYYGLLAPFSWLLEPISADLHVLGLRVLGVLLALPLPWLTWWLGVELVRQRGVALGAAGLAALNGPVVAATSAVNNDALACTAAALALALAATVLRGGLTPTRAVALGGAVSLAGLTKVTALPVALIAGLALLAAPRAAPRRAIGIGLAVAAPGGVWWLHNLLTEGRLTPGGSELIDTSGPATAGPDGPFTYAAEHLGLLLHRALGLYGWAQVLVPDWLAWGALVLVSLLAIGWAATGSVTTAWPSRRMLLLAAAPVLTVAATIASSYGNYQRTGAITGLAGRYLYPAAPLVWVALVTAVAAVGRRWWPGLALRLAPSAVGFAGVAGVASLGLCLTGLYGTVGVRTLLRRMELVAPIASAGPAVAMLVLLVGATLLLSVRSATSAAS